MKKLYYRPQLSAKERAFFEMVLLEEMEVQGWFAVLYSGLMSEEFIICLH